MLSIRPTTLTPGASQFWDPWSILVLLKVQTRFGLLQATRTRYELENLIEYRGRNCETDYPVLNGKKFTSRP